MCVCIGLVGECFCKVAEAVWGEVVEDVVWGVGEVKEGFAGVVVGSVVFDNVAEA